MIVCAHCQKNININKSEKVLRRDTCPQCLGDLHCCKMCQFYDPSCYNECKETMASRVTDKEKSNFCDYFNLSGSINPNDASKHAKAQADALFKK